MRPTVEVLTRRDNGTTVWVMDHDRTAEAIAHAASLTARLSATGLWDIARDLGIPLEPIADAQPDDSL